MCKFKHNGWETEQGRRRKRKRRAEAPFTHKKRVMEEIVHNWILLINSIFTQNSATIAKQTISNVYLLSATLF